MATNTSSADRGRSAERPEDIPARGWKDIALRVKAEMDEDHATLMAAGVAFYGLLAVFPGIAALISIWALVTDPQTLVGQLDALSRALPAEAATILTGQARTEAEGADARTGFAALIGLALALWAASRGVKALMEGVNIAYAEKDERGFRKQNLIALTLTLAIVAGMIVAVGLITVLPAVLGSTELGGWEIVWTVLPWPLLFVGGAGLLAVIYRFAPDREPAQWRWLSWGAVAAMALWVIGSIGFQIYVANFGDYNASYSAIGGVIVLLLWLWLSALCVLIGAEINAETERQTRQDTTQGRPEALGRRGAQAADTVGEARG